MAPDVERIVLAASQYGDSRFGELDDLRLTLADRAGEALLGYSITEAGVESAFLFGELYRRGDGWKFRAIGQGYETGLAGLATDFGIDVDDEGDDAGAESTVTAKSPGEALQPAVAEPVVTQYLDGPTFTGGIQLPTLPTAARTDFTHSIAAYQHMTGTQFEHAVADLARGDPSVRTATVSGGTNDRAPSTSSSNSPTAAASPSSASATHHRTASEHPSSTP